MKSAKSYLQIKYEEARYRKLREEWFKIENFFRRQYPALVFGALFTASLVFAVLSYRSRRGSDVFDFSQKDILGRQTGSPSAAAASSSVSPSPSAVPPLEIKAGQKSETSLLNINTAPVEAIDRLPGVSPQVAGNIVRYRQEHGPFRETRELMKVSGIKERRFAALESLVTVGP